MGRQCKYETEEERKEAKTKRVKEYQQANRLQYVEANRRYRQKLKEKRVEELAELDRLRKLTEKLELN